MPVLVWCPTKMSSFRAGTTVGFVCFETGLWDLMPGNRCHVLFRPIDCLGTKSRNAVCFFHRKWKE